MKVVAHGPSNDATCIGFGACSRESFNATVSQLRKLGLAPATGTDAENRERRVAEMVRAPAPWGVDVELVFWLENAATPFASPVFPEGFITRDQGLVISYLRSPAFRSIRTPAGSPWKGLDLKCPTPCACPWALGK